MDVRTTRKGLFEGLSRIITELLKSPSFKKKVGIVLENLDPENAALLVRAIMWEDAGLFLSIVGSVPDLINSVIYGLKELVTGLNSFTPEALSGFLSAGAREIDFEAFGELLGLLAAVSLRMSEREKVEGREPASGAAKLFLSGLKKGLAEWVSSEEKRAALADKISQGIFARLSELEEKLAKGDPTIREVSERFKDALNRVSSDYPRVIQGFLRPLGKLIAFENDDENAG